jgi:hypothetical protein
MPEMIQANCCGARWTGLGAAHCSACHHTFTSAGAFDRHRRNGKCLPPETIGLVKADRDWPGWSWPGTWAGPQSA